MLILQDNRGEPIIPRPPRRPYWRWIAIAAFIILLILLSLFLPIPKRVRGATLLAQDFTEPTPSGTPAAQATMTPVATNSGHVYLPVQASWPQIVLYVFPKGKNQFISLDVLVNEDIVVYWRLWLHDGDLLMKMAEDRFGVGPRRIRPRVISLQDLDLPYPLPPGGSLKFEMWFNWDGGRHHLSTEEEFTYTPPTPTPTATPTPESIATPEPEPTATPEATPEPALRRRAR